jgi:hypothetical protein
LLSVPKSNSASSLKDQIVAARATMIRGRYMAEAGWLARIDTSPDSCGTTGAREGLRVTSVVARELGFPDVADWINEFLDSAD